MQGKYGKWDMSKDARDPSFVVRYLTITAHWAHNPPSIMRPHVLQMMRWSIMLEEKNTAEITFAGNLTPSIMLPHVLQMTLVYNDA